MPVEKDIVVSHPEGLHARPAASLVRLAKAYSGNITLNWDNQVIDARSILDILSAGIDCGDVINLASVSGKRPLARRTPYTASKMAVIGLSVTLAHEVGPLGITVNTLSPGPVRGPRMERNFRLEAERTGTTSAEAEEAFVSRSALQRMVTEEEVGAAAVAMLRMPGLSGADIDLSAGMVAR